MDDNNLQKNTTEKLIALLNVATGWHPYVGPIAKILTDLIPNQQIDRIAKCVEELSNHVKINDILRYINDPRFVDLMGEGLHQAAEAYTEERRRHICVIIKNSIEDTILSFIEAKYIMKTLKEINDAEVIILASYNYSYAGEFNEFKKFHDNIFQYEHIFLGSSDEINQKGAIYKNYCNHLEVLGLLNRKALRNFDVYKREDEMQFDEFTGDIAKSDYLITPYGKLLMSYLDIDKSY